MGAFDATANASFYSRHVFRLPSTLAVTTGHFDSSDDSGMATPKVFSLVSLFLLVAVTLMQARATDLWLYDHNDYDKHKTFKKFNFGTSQRCHSLVNCFNDKASSASWINAPDAAWFVFYDGEECSGPHYILRSTPSGETKFALGEIDNKVSSFMIWEYGTVALNGFVDICEAAVLRSANTTTNSPQLVEPAVASNATINFY
ncbi:unnamed protein product [Phytophthora fragariaefolia]|uniref:Unnamed protein product n=1 Tax=Phytophthora fragariaefolia TaxID=1490495 RepID=A0A9W6Y4Z2_9STRA|nr:unnamed protein product [Phytophthora fragariaefolia]